jgi:sodium-coupled neutral amino acid transporter 11
MKRRSLLLLLLCSVMCIATGRRTAFGERQPLRKPATALARRGSATKEEEQEGGSTSTGASIFNLVNNVAGAGILALPAGQAAGTGWIPSLVMCAMLGALSARTFVMIGEACEMTGEEDFKGLWSHTIGAGSTFLVDTLIAILCVAVSVIYSGILGDVATPLLQQAGVPDAMNGRTSNILVLTISLLLPMSLINDLSALAFTSVLGFCSILYTVSFMVIRALDGSYGSSSRFLEDLERVPAFTKSSLLRTNFSSLILASNLGLAFVAHYNGPTFYRALKDTKEADGKGFSKMVYAAFTLLVLLYQIAMSAGYSTFGDVCQGNILLNYHPDDKLAALGRIATWFSILFGFPLVSTGARESLLGVASAFGYTLNPNILVVAILTLVTYISCTVKDVSVVVGLTGAVLGSFICYVCPALLYTRAVKQVQGQEAYEKVRWNLWLVPFGICLGGFGTYMNLKGPSS